jgi:hypothetical protein
MVRDDFNVTHISERDKLSKSSNALILFVIDDLLRVEKPSIKKTVDMLDIVV